MRVTYVKRIRLLEIYEKYTCHSTYDIQISCELNLFRVR